jgi:hypothetical protein
VAPAAPPADPVMLGDPDAAPDCDSVDGDKTDDEEDDGEGVCPLRASDPTAFPLLFAPVLALLFALVFALGFALIFSWPLGCDVVWPWAVVMPISIIVMMKMSFIALSCV